jgi:alpha-N-arabinofuranosidase
VVKRVSLLALRLYFGMELHGQVTVLQPIPQLATIDVNAASTIGAPIPRTTFGTFLEPIGNST